MLNGKRLKLLLSKKVYHILKNVETGEVYYKRLCNRHIFCIIKNNNQSHPPN